MIQLILILLLSTNVFAETTADVTEKDAGATHLCSRGNSECTADPRTDIYSDGGTDDDIVYWDQHGHISSQYGNGTYDTDFNITNDISAFMTEAEMQQGFTLDSSIGLRDRNYVGGDGFRIKIKVTDGTTTYTDTANFTTSAGQLYETITSQLIVPENTLSYSLATFGLILSGDSLTNGYNGPQTNAINLTSTYEIINEVLATVTDIVDAAVNDILDSSTIETAIMQVNVATPSGTTNLSIPVTASGGTVSMSIPTVSGGIQKIQINTGMTSSPSSDPKPTTEVAEAVAEVAEAVEESQESESSSDKKETSETKTEKTKEKAVQAIVARVLQAVEIAGGDTDTTKLALMGILNTSAFKSYQQQDIPDVAFFDNSVSYESAQMPDMLGSIFSLGSDQMFEEMTNTQY